MTEVKNLQQTTILFQSGSDPAPGLTVDTQKLKPKNSWVIGLFGFWLSLIEHL